MRTLYATNNLGNSLTPIDPITGKIAGPNIPVDDPVQPVLHARTASPRSLSPNDRQRLDFRDPHTFALQKSLTLDCAGIDHLDFSADDHYLIASCEFSGRLVKVDLADKARRRLSRPPGLESSRRQARTRRQDLLRRRSQTRWCTPDRRSLLSGSRLHPDRNRRARPLPEPRRQTASTCRTGAAHRSASSTSPRARSSQRGGSPAPVPTWAACRADGKVLWLAGRYNAAVYAISTIDGHLIASIHVPNRPHGLCVWPQPGRYSLGHTGVMR